MRREVSIPFRAVTGFERRRNGLCKKATTEFQSLSGLSLGLNWRSQTTEDLNMKKFQSLSGLSLGLNIPARLFEGAWHHYVSIPFRAVTGFEPIPVGGLVLWIMISFNPFQGCHWV